MPDPLAASVAAVTGQVPTAGGPGGGLAGEAARQNLAAAPSLDSLAQLISGINQRAYLSAPGRQAQLGNIQNELAGNLDPQTVQGAQLRAAERYGSAGFGVDSGAWQSAVQRALGLSRQGLEAQGAQELNALYSGMPVTDASRFAITPDLLQRQQQAAAQLAEQSREFDVSTAQGQQQFMANLQQRAAEAAAANAQASAALAEKQREYDITHSTDVAQEIARLQEQAREANQNAQLEAEKLQIAGQQFAQSQAQQQAQFTAQQAQQFALEQARLGEQAREFGGTQGLDYARLYSQLYGTLPGYSSTGQYTGILGGFPATGSTGGTEFLNTQFPPFNTPAAPTAGTRTATTPQVMGGGTLPVDPATLFAQQYLLGGRGRYFP